MIQFALSNGFYLKEVEKGEDIKENRLWLEKNLQES